MVELHHCTNKIKNTPELTQRIKEHYSIHGDKTHNDVI